MRETFFNDPESMKWLFEVHLPFICGNKSHFRSAILFGNEDYPKRIELYQSLNPNYKDQPLSIDMTWFDKFA